MREPSALTRNPRPSRALARTDPESESSRTPVVPATLPRLGAGGEGDAYLHGMHIVIAGGHGQVARRLGALAVARGDRVTGLVRNPAQLPDLSQLGVGGVVLDLETATTAAVTEALRGADAVVFAAGAGPGSGAARKDTVDRAAAVVVADGAAAAGVPRLLQVSAMGVDSVRDGGVPGGREEVFVAYLRAKLAAEEDLRARSGSGTLRWTIIRPGRLTDSPGTGRVRLAQSVPRASVSRDDVAAVLLALLDEPGTAGMTLELVAGETPVSRAVRELVEAS